MKRERWQTKSDGEGASAAEAKCREATREVARRRGEVAAKPSIEVKTILNLLLHVIE